MPLQAAIEREAYGHLLSAVEQYRQAQRAVIDAGGELPESEIPLEAQLADAQAHCGRLDNMLAAIRAALRSELRWTDMKPAMSGVYLNCRDFADPPYAWQVVQINTAGQYFSSGPHVFPYWLGPISISR